MTRRRWGWYVAIIKGFGVKGLELTGETRQAASSVSPTVTLLNRLVRAVLLIVAVWAGAMVSLWLIAERTRATTATETSVSLLHTVLRAEERRLGLTARDYVWWDESIRNILVDFDPDWADNNIGRYLHEAFDITLSLVIAGDGRLIYGARDGARLVPPDASALSAGFGALVDEARADRVDLLPRWVAGTALLDGVPVLVAVSPFTPERPDSPPTPDSNAVLVLARPLDADWVGTLGQDYHLDGLALRPVDAPMPAGHTADTRLITRDGVALAALSWQPRIPGDRVDTNVLVTMSVLSVVMMALLAVFLSRARRLARRLAEDEAARTEQAQALAESEERLRLVVANAPVLLVVSDRDGDILLMEGGAHGLRDALPDAEAGAPFAHTLDRMPALADIVRRAERGQTAHGEVTSGAHTLEVACAPLRDRHGHRCGVVAVLVDISERKTMENTLRRALDELTRSNGELERFAYVASHDLQEPVRTLVGYAQLIRRRYDDHLDDDGRTFLSYIENGALRMRSLVQGLLTYSRLGAEAALPEPVDAGTSLASALDNMAAMVREAGASIVAGRLPVVHAEPLQLMQVFQNLIGNALKFRHPDRRPQITITAEPAREGWQITVRDNGIGIPADSLHTIFGLFKRLHGPTVYPGTGVGLAICQRIIERSGGRIWATSDGESGAAFHFILPAVPDGSANPGGGNGDVPAMPKLLPQV